MLRWSPAASRHSRKRSKTTSKRHRGIARPEGPRGRTAKIVRPRPLFPGPPLAPRSVPPDRCPPGCEQKQFAWLYTVYSIPNTVLPFLGGFFVDKMSARLMNIVFCGCILVGQFIFAVGVFAGSFPIMIAGRVVFGLGGESLCVGQSALVQQWFCESLNDHTPADGGSIQARAPSLPPPPAAAA